MELTEVTYEVLATGDKMPSGYYLKADVDAVLAEKDKEIARLKADYNAEVEKVCVEKTNVDTLEQAWKERVKEVEILNTEIAELKAKLEDVQASAYAESVDAGMRERRLKRALYKACANWAHFAVAFFSSYATKEKWHKMERKCLKNAEEYK